MKTKITKWGNSMALRIPKSFAKQIELKEGTPVDLKIEEDRLVITTKKEKHSLNDLLNEISEENIHRETDFGTSEGNEAW